MKKSELRVAVQEMDTYQFSLKNELHNKLTKVTSYVPKKEVIDLIDQLEEPEQDINAAYDLLQENTTLSQEDFDLYWNCINDGVAIRELKESSTNNSDELKQAEKDMKEVNQKSKDVLNSLK